MPYFLSFFSVSTSCSSVAKGSVPKGSVKNVITNPFQYCNKLVINLRLLLFMSTLKSNFLLTCFYSI